jgi:hypothetical protein
METNEHEEAASVSSSLGGDNMGKGGMSKAARDNRSRQLNPHDSVHESSISSTKASLDNRSMQLNPQTEVGKKSQSAQNESSKSE